MDKKEVVRLLKSFIKGIEDNVYEDSVLINGNISITPTDKIATWNWNRGNNTP